MYIVATAANLIWERGGTKISLASLTPKFTTLIIVCELAGLAIGRPPCYVGIHICNRAQAVPPHVQIPKLHFESNLPKALCFVNS